MNTTKRQVRVLNDKHSKQQKNEIFASAKNKKRKNDSTAEKARENYNYNYFSFFFFVFDVECISFHSVSRVEPQHCFHPGRETLLL